MLLYSEAYSCNSTKKNHSKILINRDHIEKDHIKNFVCSENIRRYFSNINLIQQVLTDNYRSFQASGKHDKCNLLSNCAVLC